MPRRQRRDAPSNETLSPVARRAIVTEVTERVTHRVERLVTERVEERLRRTRRDTQALVAQVSRGLSEELRFERERLGV
jgi:hypothetical protein